jgi:hypothetical protein
MSDPTPRVEVTQVLLFPPNYALVLLVTLPAGEQQRHQIRHARLRREFGQRAAPRHDKRSAHNCDR